MLISPEILAQVQSLSDTDAATAINQPIKTPRTAHVTYTTLGDIWGPLDAAAFRARLKAANNPLADYVDTLLSGNGFDPANSNTPAVAAQLVAASLCTQEAADSAILATSYACGQRVTANDVTASRLIATCRAWEQSSRESVVTDIANKSAAFVSSVEAWRQSGQGEAPVFNL